MTRLGFVFAVTMAVALASAPTPARAADIASGAALYRVHCQSCHGTRGAGDVPGTTAFARARALNRPDMDIVRALERGGSGKPGFFGILTEPQLYDVVAYLRTLQ